jgi:hypothetical protein
MLTGQKNHFLENKPVVIKLSPADNFIPHWQLFAPYIALRCEYTGHSDHHLIAEKNVYSIGKLLPEIKK